MAHYSQGEKNMTLTKHNQWKLNSYVDFEYRCSLRELCNFEVMESCRPNAYSMGMYFAQIGKRLGEVKGLDKSLQERMISLTRNYTPENFFEFGKLLVGMNPQTPLTMQEVLSLESDYMTRLAA